MSFFRGMKRIYNETKEDDKIIRDSADRQPVFNTRCQFTDIGFANINTMHFYVPSISSSLPKDFKICQDCFIASIAPTPFARSFVREMKSSKDPEEFVACVLSNPLNEPAWRQAVQQGSEGPLVQRAKELSVRAANLSKCPGDGTAPPSSTTEVVGFRVLRRQCSNRAFSICEHHFILCIQGLWIEDEFTKLHNSGPRTPCDFSGRKFGFGYLALQLAMRAFNPKIFEDWAINSVAVDSLPCNGVIHSTKFVPTGALLALQGSKDQIQMCADCYHLILEPHVLVRPHFKEVKIPVGQRQSCLINEGNLVAFMEALVKATWKQDANILLEVARDQSRVPFCPGPTRAAKMKNWYGSEAVGVFMCCEECWQDIIVPSPLYKSFGRYSDEGNTGEYTCDMAIEKIRPLFAAACKQGSIETFKISLEQLVNKMQADSAAAQTAAQQAHQDTYNPELDLSRVRCLPSLKVQLEELAEDIKRLDSEAATHEEDYLTDMTTASTSELSGSWSRMGRGLDPHAEYVRYSDGHNQWFDSEGGAKASRIRKESAWKQQEAMRLRILAAQKRDLLASMKRSLTPVS